jgi:hypothetical protein
MTQFCAKTPLCPSGFACASLGGLAESPRVSPGRPGARLGGTGAPASLGLLDVVRGYAIGAPPRIHPRGARNAARPIPGTGS